MIDINLFVAKKDSRAYLHKPFNVGRETVATNGHVMCAVKKREGFQLLSHTQKDIAKRIKAYLEEISDRKWLAKIPKAVIHMESDCGSCRGSGKEYVNCGYCKGRGCKSCDYDGERQTKGVCNDCCGSKKMIKMKISGVYLNQKYLNLVKDLPGLQLSVDGKGERLFWKTPEARGIIMGMRV